MREAQGRHANPPVSKMAAVAVALALVAAAAAGWVFRAQWRTDAPLSQAALTQAQNAHAAAGPQAGTGQALAAGPVSELDKQLLVKVRQADLWELPAGRLAQENGSSEAVKRAGLHLMDGHSHLDQLVRETARELAVPIPDQPNPDQQQWLLRLRTSHGASFDQFFANQLRNSHGKVFVAIAKVRATTKNTAIRNLAIEANKAVSDHMQVLEETGLVDSATLDDVAADVTK
jgi:predicted outer membrane protein